MSHDPLSTEAAAPPPVILITGASSGLGRSFFEHFTDPQRSHPSQRVVGVDISPWTDSAGDQHDVFRPPNSGGSAYARLDVTSPVDEQREFVRRWIGADAPVRLVVHCAGVRGLVPHVAITRSSDVASAETLDAMDAGTLLRTYQINVVGTFNVLSAVLPNLRLAAGLGLDPKVVVLSSRMGSIAANEKGGGYAYRTSKAALNAMLKSMSIDVPEVFFAMVHPGRVETGLVSVKEDGAISSRESLDDLFLLFERFGTKKELGTGCFVDRFGERIPW